jgi:2-succinyl-5-enolpyruvyl-6-hydroxy-3-cyclohexene-1-carboxylate synthase
MNTAVSSVNQAVLNRVWCQVLLEELTRFGVSEVCVAPGSRSTPLTLEADENPNLNLHTHFDERGLGFLALGMAKASGKPVAVVVTSGTAVANLLPAIAEAKLTGEKLVLLTADRPVELVACGANQAIDQSGIFSSHVTCAVELPSPSLQVPLKWLLTTVDQVMAEQEQKGSAIHINCPFPEPLYSDQPKSLYHDYSALLGDWWQSGKRFTYKHFSQPSSQPNVSDFIQRNGLIVVGSVTAGEAAQAKHLAERLGWPVLCDPQSGQSSSWSHYDLWLQNSAKTQLLTQCELILQFGSRVVSKRLNQWLANHIETTNAEYHYVSPSFDRNNASHLMQHHHVASIEVWIEHLLTSLPAVVQTNHGWADSLQSMSEQVHSLASLHLNCDAPLSEIALALTINQLPKRAQLFLGNSMFVRLVDMFSRLDSVEVYSNRGASGIDGLVATAAGTVKADKQPTVVFIGDTSLLYDVNSLALLSNEQTPVVVVVTNNDGGAIFDLLPVPEQQKQSLYQMPHGFDFMHAAQQFKLDYAKPDTLADYQRLVEQHIEQGSGALVVEIQTPAEQASNQLKEFTQQLHAL